MDVEKVMPKNTMALIKEMQIFMYGSLTDDFYIGVSTTTFKQQAQIDLEQAAEGSLKIFEAQCKVLFALVQKFFKKSFNCFLQRLVALRKVLFAQMREACKKIK